MSRITLCNMLGVTLLLSLCPLLLQAQTLEVIKRSPDPTYVTLGDTLKLNVTYENAVDGGVGVGIAWRNNSGTLLIQRFRGPGGGGAITKFDSRATLKDQATLILTNTQVSDNGKYSVNIDANNGPRTATFDVIIRVQPAAQINCYGQNNENFYCECKSDVGNPPPLAYWSNDGKMIGSKGYLAKNLTLANITKDHSPTYTCHVQSHNLTDKKSKTFGKKL